MAVDLKGMTPKQLEKLASDVSNEIAARATKQKDAALKAAAKAAKEHGCDLTELVGDAPKKRGRRKAAAKAKQIVRPPVRNRLSNREFLRNPAKRRATEQAVAQVE